MAPHLVARLRLIALCVAVGGWTGLYVAITGLTLSQLQNGRYFDYQPRTLAAWLGLCSVPALILSPFVGPLVQSRWNRPILIGGMLVVIAILAAKSSGADAPWLSLLGFLSLELAIFVPAVLAVLFSIANSARVSPTTAVWGVTIAGVAGPWITNSIAFFGRVAVPWYPLAAVGLVGVLLARARPAEPLSLSGGIVRPFVSGARDVFSGRRSLSAVIGTWLVSFVGLATVVAVFRIENIRDLVHANEMTRIGGTIADGAPDMWLEATTWKFASAVVAGVLITALNRHPYRHAGFALFGAVAGLASLLWARLGEASNAPLTLLGLSVGLALSPLLSFALIWTGPRHHGVAGSLVVAGICGSGVLLALTLADLGNDPLTGRLPMLNILVAVMAVAGLAGVAAFFRPTLELTVEVLFWPFYRIRGVGPGIGSLPFRGPYIVIGNHAAWFDPLFLAKVVPSPITPMMTSKFYDVAVLAWFMRHVVGTIRVPDKAVRHDAPELKEAVAALDRGECVVLFPESYLRRKEEVALRRFGRGVWQILRDRPTTPVFACWIEGTWGSYLSFGGGPPTKGKRMDFWRSIRIGVVGPVAIDPAILKDHMATRAFLMQQVSEARRPLGLVPLNLTTAPEAEGEPE
jgi:1-acyl-sn-glycerol-3-phosphate acyltransferase